MFEKQGLNIIPFPVDFKYENRNFTLLEFIPDVNAFKKTSRFIRENIGRLYYKIIM